MSQHSPRDWSPGKFRAYLRRHAYVPGPGGQLVKLVPNPGQDYQIRELPALRGEAGYYPVWKGRQAGETTFLLSFLAYLCDAHPGVSLLVLTPNEEPIGLEVLAKWRRLLTILSDNGASALARLRHDSKNETTFDNGSRVAWHHIGGSESVADAVGRAGTWDLVLATEYAFSHAADLARRAMEALEPALERAGAPVIFDSTPGDNPGPGEPFCEYIRRVSRGELPGRVIGLKWWQIDAPHHQDPLPCSPEEYAETLSAEELRLVTVEGVSLRGIAWRRRKIAALGRRAFLRAYPETVEDVLRPMDSGGGLFETATVERLRERRRLDAWTPPLDGEHVRAELERAGLGITGRDLLASPQWGEEDPGEGYCRVWRLPEDLVEVRARARQWGEARGSDHYAGVDTADGLSGSDWQVAHIIDRSGRLCCVLRTRVDQARFAAGLQRLLEWYGASAHVEAPHGTLVHRYLTGCYSWESFGDAPPRGASPSELRVLERAYHGELWLEATSQSGRVEILASALAALEAPGGCPDSETLREMEDLHRHPRTGKIEARSGCHDDIILSRGFAERLRVRALERAQSNLRPRARRRRRGGNTRYSYIK